MKSPSKSPSEDVRRDVWPQSGRGSRSLAGAALCFAPCVLAAGGPIELSTGLREFQSIHRGPQIGLVSKSHPCKSWSLLTSVLCQFYVNFLYFNTQLAYCLNRFLIVKALISTFSKKGAFPFSGYCEISRSPVDSSTAGCWRAGLLRFVMARQRIATVSGHLVDIISYNRY